MSKLNPETIDHCEECPHFRARVFSPNFCGKEGRILTPAFHLIFGGDVYRVPKWCPLEDADKKECAK